MIEILNKYIQTLKNNEEFNESFFDHDPLVLEKFKEINSLIEKTHIKNNWAEERVDEFNRVILEYALHSYSNKVALDDRNDIFDSLAQAINLLGEELNHSTITTYYLEDIFNSMDDMLIVIDEHEEIISLNHSTLKKLKYEQEELLKQNIFTIFPDENTLKELRDPIAIGQKQVFMTKEGDLLPVSLKISPFMRGDNTQMGSIIIAREITDLVKFQIEIENQNKEIKNINKILAQKNIELSKAKSKAEESDRLKSAFLSNMSHEIRTPMNSIIGFADLLKTIDSTNENQSLYLGIIQNNCNHLLTIIDDIMHISKIESGLVEINETPNKINDILKEIKDIFLSETKIIDHIIDLKINVPNIRLNDTVLIDKPKVVQILSNFVSNAIKYTEQGTIEIGWSLSEDRRLLFFVKDTGIGIHPDDFSAIFDKFRQLSNGVGRKFGGNGLGLSISKGLAESLQGVITVESELGVGSTFNLLLPYRSIEKLG